MVERLSDMDEFCKLCGTELVSYIVGGAEQVVCPLCITKPVIERSEGREVA